MVLSVAYANVTLAVGSLIITNTGHATRWLGLVCRRYEQTDIKLWFFLQKANPGPILYSYNFYLINVHVLKKRHVCVFFGISFLCVNFRKCQRLLVVKYNVWKYSQRFTYKINIIKWILLIILRFLLLVRIWFDASRNRVPGAFWLRLDDNIGNICKIEVPNKCSLL